MSPLVPHHPVPSTPSLWERPGWGPSRVQGRCRPMGQTQQQDPHPCHHLPWFTWMVLAMQVRMVHVWAMQAGMMQVDDACVGNAGRDVGRRVPAGGCRGSVMGCSCQEKPPKQPPHTPRELLSKRISKHQCFCHGGRQGGVFA